MKKVINSKKYNTETAQELGIYSNGSIGDFHHFEEVLYRKRTGEFFLHGAGGPASRYSQAVGQNEWSGGERIMPMSYEEAREWAEQHLEVEAYEDIFGEVAEDDTRKTINVCLSVSTIEQAKRAATQQGQTLSAWIEDLILGQQHA